MHRLFGHMFRRGAISTPVDCYLNSIDTEPLLATLAMDGLRCLARKREMAGNALTKICAISSP